MGKVLKRIMATVCLGVILFGASGCNKALSAYEIAVQNGFVGTEKEWLDMIYTDPQDRWYTIDEMLNLVPS